MQIIVLGAGINGVFTAYYLAAKGHSVRVIDRCSEVGQETTFANGGLLTPSLSAPWNAPGVGLKLFKYLGKNDAPLRLRLLVLPQLTGWGIQFLKNSRESRFVESALRNTALALHSLSCLKALREKLSLDFKHHCGGVIKISRHSTASKELDKLQGAMTDLGVEQRVLSVEELLSIEPALLPIRGALKSAVFYPRDEFGDACQCAREVFAVAQRMGVEFIFDTEITNLKQDKNDIRFLEGAKGAYEADAYVIANGSYSQAIFEKLKFPSPVRPAKGYSISTPMGSWSAPPRLPVIDADHLVVVTPFGSVIRAAGTAEFAGFDNTIDFNRIAHLKHVVAGLYPKLPVHRNGGDFSAWAGLRCVSNDGVALIGQVGGGNVFTITGQGHNGWTMAAGSAQHLAEIITGGNPTLDPNHYAPNRFFRH